MELKRLNNMINLVELKSKNVPEISAEFKDDKAYIKILGHLKESLVIFNSLFSYVDIHVEENGSAELLEVLDQNSKSVVNNTINHGEFNHIILISDDFKESYNKEVMNEKGANYKNICFDFSKNNTNLDMKLSAKAYSNGAMYLATTTEKDYKKTANINITNIDGSSTLFMDNYGISYDEGKILINGIGEIAKGAKKASNVQKATMFVMDERSKATCMPQLFISEDDVIASHANAVGQIGEETIYYLCSRGIKESVAKKMIVVGYFKSFINHIKSDEIKEYINEYMERMIQNV